MKGTMIQKKGKSQGIVFNGQEVTSGEDYEILKNSYFAIDNDSKKILTLFKSVALRYFDAGAILYNSFMNIKPSMSLAKFSTIINISAARISTSIKIFRLFEGRKEELQSLTMQDVQRLIREPKAKGEDGYNRIEFGGGKMDEPDLPFEEIPVLSNLNLQQHRVESADLRNIMVFHRWNDGKVMAKRYVEFYDDVPQDPNLRRAYKKMIEQTQTAIEEYYQQKEIAEQEGFE